MYIERKKRSTHSQILIMDFLFDVTKINTLFGSPYINYSWSGKFQTFIQIYLAPKNWTCIYIIAFNSTVTHLVYCVKISDYFSYSFHIFLTLLIVPVFCKYCFYILFLFQHVLQLSFLYSLPVSVHFKIFVIHIFLYLLIQHVDPCGFFQVFFSFSCFCTLKLCSR